MEAVSPVLPGSPELEEIFKAQDGTDRYQPLPTFHTEKAIVTRWRLSDEERAHIAAGGDLFIAILNFGNSIWPIMPIAASPEEALAITLQVEEQL